MEKKTDRRVVKTKNAIFKAFVELLNEKDINMDITKKAKNYLLEKGTDIKFGARPLRRAIQRYIEDEISDLILKSELKNGQKITITFDTKLHFNVQ